MLFHEIYSTYFQTVAKILAEAVEHPLTTEEINAIIQDYAFEESIDLEEYKASMQGIYSTSVNADTLDEAPMAYKSLADIIDVIRDSVEIIDIMKPVYNFKASDGEGGWKKKGDTNERKDTGAAS